LRKKHTFFKLKIIRKILLSVNAYGLVRINRFAIPLKTKTAEQAHFLSKNYLYNEHAKMYFKKGD